MTIRLFEWQVEKLKQCIRPAEVLRTAYSRFNKGEFENVVQNATLKNNESKCTTLKPFTIRERLPISDANMREVLTMHWDNPDMKRQKELQEEIAKMDAMIDEMFRAYTGKEYVIMQEEV